MPLELPGGEELRGNIQRGKEGRVINTKVGNSIGQIHRRRASKGQVYTPTTMSVHHISVEGLMTMIHQSPEIRECHRRDGERAS